MQICLPKERGCEFALPLSDGEKSTARLVRTSVSVQQNEKMGGFSGILPLQNQNLAYTHGNHTIWKEL